MGRGIQIGLLVALVAVAIAVIVVFDAVNSIEEVEVTPDVHVLHGLGGNVGILRTPHGAVVVDTLTFRMQGRRVRERAEVLGGGAAQAVINTHYHFDHTHGNPAFAGGLPVVATHRTLGYLKALDSGYWEGEASRRLPNVLFDDVHELRFGHKTVRLFHFGRGHTDGDLVVHFVQDRVVHVGDLFFNGSYPNIDLEAGGSVQEWAATIDRVLELPFDHVIPGHGPVTDRAGLVAFQGFMRQLADVATAAAAADRDLAETQASAELDDDGLQAEGIPILMWRDRDFVLRRAWEEATGNFERVTLP
jgi:glyoxylase-like metal-dependent hydrolase (beta-lactamase superfamily II)